MVLVSVNAEGKGKVKEKIKENRVHLVTSPPPQGIASTQLPPISYAAEKGQPIEVSQGMLLEQVPVRHKTGGQFSP